MNENTEYQAISKMYDLLLDEFNLKLGDVMVNAYQQLGKERFSFSITFRIPCDKREFRNVAEIDEYPSGYAVQPNSTIYTPKEALEVARLLLAASRVATRLQAIAVLIDTDKEQTE